MGLKVGIKILLLAIIVGLIFQVKKSLQSPTTVSSIRQAQYQLIPPSKAVTTQSSTFKVPLEQVELIDEKFSLKDLGQVQSLKAKSKLSLEYNKKAQGAHFLEPQEGFNLRPTDQFYQNVLNNDFNLYEVLRQTDIRNPPVKAEYTIKF